MKTSDEFLNEIKCSLHIIIKAYSATPFTGSLIGTLKNQIIKIERYQAEKKQVNNTTE